MKNDPSYSDNFLLTFHNQAQDEKQTETNSLNLWNEDLEREQMLVKEWQDSFQRNGLADFTPPMSAGLNCLMVGAPEDVGIKLPWEDEAEATITPLQVPEEEATKDVVAVADSSSINIMPIIDYSIVVSEPNNADEIDVPSSITKNTLPSQESSSDLVVALSTSSKAPRPAVAATATTLSKASQTPAARYDCIVDRGLLDSVMALDDAQAAQELLFEAATAIREFGIYVYVADRPLSKTTKDLLQESGELAGLEWQFELDGLLENGEIVSVARRYNTGVLPSVGKLSRFQVR